MNGLDTRRGVAELKAARNKALPLFIVVFVFSFFVNLLMLTAPLYMLQVYDRVLGSQSEATLVALSVLLVFAFVIMGALDHVRARIMARAATAFQSGLDRRVFQASVRRLTLVPNDPVALPAQQDLDAVQRWYGSPVLIAFFDLPWSPLFFVAIFIFHPMLGWLSVFGALALVLVTVMNQLLTRKPQSEASGAAMQAEQFGTSLRAEAETVKALGMESSGFARWMQARIRAQQATLSLADLGGAFGVVTKTFRMFLQSAMLGLGAWLVLKGELSPGAMIAGSILMGRALAPVELLVGQWAVLQRARDGWARLGALLTLQPADQPRTALPRPRAILEAQNITVAPPGDPNAALRGVSFRLEPGQALGVIGPSGSGKSTLARTLTHIWRPAGGKVRLDGASLEQYDPDVLGGYIGYLPQRVGLFDGTISENIARLAATPDAEKVVAAAKKAAVHDMIVKLPDGYDTRMSAVGGRLSGGQIQRIGLARALYGDPVFLVLDEPNSNLDNDGSVALNHAIRAMKDAGGCVLIMAHRPAAIQECDLLLVLEDGMRRAFGPRDQVLREMVKNHTEIVRNTGAGGTT